MDQANNFRDSTLKLPNVKSIIKTIDTPTDWEYEIEYKGPSTVEQKEEGDDLVRKLLKEGTIKKIGEQRYIFDSGIWFDYTGNI